MIAQDTIVGMEKDLKILSYFRNNPENRMDVREYWYFANKYNVYELSKGLDTIYDILIKKFTDEELLEILL